MCPKLCKSQGGLKNHKRRKHSEETAEQEEAVSKHSHYGLNHEELHAAIISTCKKIVSTAVFPDSVLLQLDSFIPTEEQVEGLQDLLLSFSGKNYDKLYKWYYANVVKNGQQLFDIERNASTILAIKLLDVILKQSAEKLEKTEIIGHNLAQRDLAAMQYLGGYVCRNIYRKLRCSKNYQSNESQQALSILKLCKTERSDNFALVSSLDRGGLWYISEYMQKIFVIAEKYFCIQSEKNSTMRTLDIHKMYLDLYNFPFIRENFDMLAGMADLEIENETKKNMLISILKLYLQIRAFSYARDVTAKFKANKKKKKEKGGLRKGIKNSMAENLPSSS